MAVIAVWKCDRDDSMFANKKDAEEHDKMLELAENISALVEQNIKGLNDQQSEAIGLLLAKHKDALAKACKGKPEALFESSMKNEADNTTEKEDDKVRSIAASA